MSSIEYLDFASGMVTTIAEVTSPVLLDLKISPGRPFHLESDLMLVEDFR